MSGVVWEASGLLSGRRAAAAAVPYAAAWVKPFVHHFAAAASGGSGSVSSGGSECGIPPDLEDELNRPATPWVRTVISGVALLHTPKYNKGLAFTQQERDRLYLRGLLPAATVSQDVQSERIVMNLQAKANDLERLDYLLSLQGRNERLFFYVLSKHIQDLLHVVYQPTVSAYCQQYSLMFRSLPRGLFVSMKDKGQVFSLLKNWPERRIKMLCLTDGEAVGPYGDLGVQGIGVATSKLALYTACGGIKPEQCLPICLDVGTDNDELLSSPFYVGERHPRVRGDAYYELMDELLTAVRRRYGNSVLLHFQDMEHNNVARLVAQYRGELMCYSDELQGTATTVLAGVLGALPAMKGSLGDQTIVISGEGPLGPTVAEMIATAASRNDPMGVFTARKRIWLVDSKGLVCKARGDADTLEAYKLQYCHDGGVTAPCPSLRAAVSQLKPSILIGLSTGPPPFKFDREVCSIMAAAHERPLIMPLSKPSVFCPADAYEWTAGKALFANGEGREGTVTAAGGRSFSYSSAHGVYVFPGMALGALMARCTRLRDDMFLSAAQAVASMVTNEDRAAGRIYPPVTKAREIARQVARAVAGLAYETGLATEMPKPHDLVDAAKRFMYYPDYRKYR